MSQPFDLAKAAEKLPALLASQDAEKRAEAERLIAEADTRHIGSDLFQRAAHHAQSGGGPPFWMFLLTMIGLFSERPIRRTIGHLLPTKWESVFLLTFGVLMLLYVVGTLRRGINKVPLFAVVFEWLKRDKVNPKQVLPFLLDCWQPGRKAPQNADAERALTDWLVGYAMNRTDELSPEKVGKLGKQARKLFRVVRWRGKVVRVHPRGAFSDSRADLLVTFFQHLMLRPDIQTHERAKERELLQIASQLQGTTENHALVREAARVLLEPKGKAQTVTATFPIYSNTPPAPATVVTLQRKP